MDTKLKKWKITVSFIAFLLGLSLFISGALPLCMRIMHSDMNEWLERDYQNTQEFRSIICNYLDMMLHLAVHKNNPAGEQEEDIFKPYRESITVEAAYDYTTNDTFFIRQGGISPNMLPKEDKNILYRVDYDGVTEYTNSEGIHLTGKPESLPEDYNFLLYFDGKKTTIYKDGKEIEIQQDSYYTENQSWYVPGYPNFTVDEQTAKASVIIAAREKPAIFIVGKYASSGLANRYNEFYWLNQQQQERYRATIFQIVSTLVGLALILIVLFFLRKEKKEAEIFIAKKTSRLPLEAKLLLLFLSILPFLSQTDFMQTLDWIIVHPETYAIEAPWYLYNGLCYEATHLLPFIWITYLIINEMRFTKGFFSRSLSSKIARTLSASHLKLPVQKAFARQTAAATLLSFLAACSFCLFLFFCKNPAVNLPFALLFLLVSLLSIGILICLSKRQQATAEEIGLLVEKIGMIQNGDLTSPLLLPQDADLLCASQQLNDIQQGMQKALSEQIKSEHLKVELIANVSHDVKTPLTSIISYIDLLEQEESLPEHVRDYIKILDSKAQRLKTMIQDVMEVSKATSGNLPVKLETLDYAKLLWQTIADMSQNIADSTVELKTDLPETPVYICADGQRLYRVFQNLIQNALSYSLDGSRIYLSLNINGTAAAAQIQNTSKNEIPKDIDFMERFMRGDQSRTDGGSGLGLSIANSFTAACGGLLELQTVADLFTVTVTFPIVPEEAHDVPLSQDTQ